MMPRLTHRRRRQEAAGQTLIEFALILPLFLFLLFGLVDMGRYVYLNSTLSQAAREGARLASVEASWVASADASCGTAEGPVCPGGLPDLRAHVLAAANRMMVATGTITDAQLHLSCVAAAATPPSGTWTSPPNTCATRTTGSLVSVRVEFTFRPITPVIGQLFSSIKTAASTTMVIN
jgi:Flp pilus assembly protein TadG